MSESPLFCYQGCPQCHRAFYLTIWNCPVCGAVLIAKSACTSGTVRARCVIHRAPSETWQQQVPYLLCLVEMDAGFRMMAHGDLTLAIDERVVGEVREIANTRLPYFSRQHLV